ncbi:MAG: 4Fe-4S dicluster domain-containing protein [Alistipes sp.]|nr:4Fe-4S dicluster domain-containing protein [Alistipes sp.]
MLKKLRVILGALFFTLITLLFLDFTGAAHAWFGWMAKVQLVPAILAGSFVIIAVLALLTLVFGRVYCSVICPLGVCQDVVSWTAGRVQKKRRFSFSPALTWLRWGFFSLFVVALLVHVEAVKSLLEPYSAYGRIASNIFAPIYRLGNNGLAFLAERADGYAFYPVTVWVKSGVTLAIALLTLLVVGFLAWRGGRTYCNTVCPVGTLLGFVSKYSLYKPVIDPQKCTKCSQCARVCKASCIDYKEYSIDHSRCVACMNCLDKCKFDALHYTVKRPAKVQAEAAAGGAAVSETTEGGISRRGFLAVAGMVAAANTLKGQAPEIVDGGLAIIEDKKIPDRETAVVPPGSQGSRHMKVHCTACQLCVSACPNDILRPSSKLSTFMQPEMAFEKGFCRPECTRCSEVCPNGAIRRITPAEKSSVQIGRAVWIKENCVVNVNGDTCTACQRNCPTGAIALVPRADGDELKIPVVDTEACIGCGACEYVCPARPLSAIYVEGLTRHRTI